MEYLHYGCLSRSKKFDEKQRRRFHWWMLYEEVDNCLLRLFECFLESAPQLAWQLYILMYEPPTEDAIGSKYFLLSTSPGYPVSRSLDLWLEGCRLISGIWRSMRDYLYSFYTVCLPCSFQWDMKLRSWFNHLKCKTKLFPMLSVIHISSEQAHIGFLLRLIVTAHRCFRCIYFRFYLSVFICFQGKVASIFVNHRYL